MKLLLDTCTFLWLTAGSREISKTCAELFQDPANEVFLSVVSSWEISIKHSLGKLSLPEPPRTFIPSRRKVYQVDSLPLREDEALQTGNLPQLHADPFDRMLICQSLVRGMAILTPDPLISQYPARVIW